MKEWHMSSCPHTKYVYDQKPGVVIQPKLSTPVYQKSYMDIHLLINLLTY